MSAVSTRPGVRPGVSFGGADSRFGHHSHLFTLHFWASSQPQKHLPTPYSHDVKCNIVCEHPFGRMNFLPVLNTRLASRLSAQRRGYSFLAFALILMAIPAFSVTKAVSHARIH